MFWVPNDLEDSPFKSDRTHCLTKALHFNTEASLFSPHPPASKTISQLVLAILVDVRHSQCTAGNVNLHAASSYSDKDMLCVETALLHLIDKHELAIAATTYVHACIHQPYIHRKLWPAKQLGNFCGLTN